MRFKFNRIKGLIKCNENILLCEIDYVKNFMIIFLFILLFKVYFLMY